MRISRRCLAVLGCGLLLAMGCTRTDIVYRDRQPFNPAPDAVSGLLGYYNFSTKQTTCGNCPAWQLPQVVFSTKQTTCGNCHAGHQADWFETKHASAFTDLVASGHATAACYGCHTVSQLGNGLASAAGWNAKPDSAYKDVQCESCHGPGTEHVKLTEDRTKWPLARLTLTIANNSCAACHTGIHE